MASKKETKRINKVNDGDVFIIPISNGNYGMGQVIRKSSRRMIDGWMCLFDKEFTQTEVNDFENIDINELPVLSVMPLMYSLIKSKEWPRIGNRLIVPISLPMFQDRNSGKGNRTHYIMYNLERTFVRDIQNPVINSMVGGFSLGATYFKDLCELKWGNPDMVHPHATRGKWTLDTYYYYWPANCPIEDDMIVNSHLYSSWAEHAW